MGTPTTHLAGRHRRKLVNSGLDTRSQTPLAGSGASAGAQTTTLSAGSTVASNIVLMTIANVAVPLCGLATAPLLARGLGVDDRGAVAAGTAPLLLAIAVGTFGLPEAITARTARAQAISKQALLSTLAAILGLGAVLTLAAVIAAPGLARGNDQVRDLIIDAIPFLVPCLMLTPIRAVASALGRWKLVAAEQAIAAFLRVVLITALFTTGHLTALSATIVTAVPLLLGGVVYLALKSSSDEWLTRDDGDFRGLLSFGGRIWAGYLGGIVLLRLDQLVMVPLSGEYQLGIYVVAVTVAEILLVITNAARDVTFASDSADVDDGRAAMTARLAGVACVLATAFTIAVGPVLVPLVFGAAFRPAVLVIDVLLLAIVVLTPGSVAGGVLIARGYPGRRSAAIVTGAIVNVGLLLAFVPTHGAMGAAVATLIGNAVFGGLNLLFLRQCTGNAVRHFIVPRRADLVIVRLLVLERLIAMRAAQRPSETGTPTHTDAAPAVKRLGGLDVLRGLAVLLVVIRHAAPESARGAGIVGVTVFFALSGYLITGLLTKQLSQRGAGAFVPFYISRAWRLYPPLLVLIAAFIAVGFLTGLTGSTHVSIVATAFLGAAYLLDLPLYGQASLSLGHLWTLAVEEQFYLIWPFVVWYLIKRPNFARRMIYVSVAIVGVQWAVSGLKSHDPRFLYSLPTSWFACLSLGALARLYEERLRSIARTPVALLCAAALIVLCAVDLKVQTATYFVGGLAIAALAVPIILWAAAHADVPTLLKPLQGLGLISYSVYLWNYPLVNWISGPAAYGEPTVAQGIAAGLGAIGVAVLSWYALERPIQARRRRRASRPAESPTRA